MVSSTMTTDFLAHKKDMGNLFVFHSLCTLFQLTLSATAYFRAANPRGGVADSAPPPSIFKTTQPNGYKILLAIFMDVFCYKTIFQFFPITRGNFSKIAARSTRIRE